MYLFCHGYSFSSSLNNQQIFRTISPRMIDVCKWIYFKRLWSNIIIFNDMSIVYRILIKTVFQIFFLPYVELAIIFPDYFSCGRRKFFNVFCKFTSHSLSIMGTFNNYWFSCWLKSNRYFIVLPIWNWYKY